MVRLFEIAALITFACLAIGSCADLSPSGEDFGPLTMETLQTTDAIPASYGDLIAVTTAEVYPGWAQLWFQKEDKTVVTVFLNFSRGYVKDRALTIPRS